VVPVGLIDGFEVGRPSGPRGCKKGCIKPGCLRGPEGGVVGSFELREDVRPPRLGVVSNPVNPGVKC